MTSFGGTVSGSQKKVQEQTQTAQAWKIITAQNDKNHMAGCIVLHRLFSPFRSCCQCRHFTKLAWSANASEEND
jgi:hypothetical protein